MIVRLKKKKAMNSLQKISAPKQTCLLIPFSVAFVECPQYGLRKNVACIMAQKVLNIEVRNFSVCFQ